MRSLFLMLFSLCFSGVALADYNYQPLKNGVMARLQDGDERAVAEQALDAMIKVGAAQLRARGFAVDAARMEQEWDSFGRDALYGFAAVKDVGDHDPLIVWLAELYAELEAKLGVPVMEATHLRDIWVMLYSIPVVFNRDASSAWCVQTVQNNPDDNCRDEYRRHFSGTKFQIKPDANRDDVLHHGFAPVCVYWLVWVGCEAATSGAGSLACGIAGDAAELSVERWIAPGVSNRLFDRANAQSHASADWCQCCDCPCDECDCGADCPCCDCCQDEIGQDPGTARPVDGDRLD